MFSEGEVRDCLRQIPLWPDLPEEFINFWVTHGRVHHYAGKQYLYFSGDPANLVFVLLRGRVQLLLTSEFTEKIFRVLSAPCFFPEVALDGKTYPHTALAVEPTEALVMERTVLRQYLESNPASIWPFYQALALDLRRAYRQIKNLTLGDARVRLGAKLFALAHAHGRAVADGILIALPLSASELAVMCGLARESVSRILAELRELGLIRVERKIVKVLDLERLRSWIYEHGS